MWSTVDGAVRRTRRLAVPARPPARRRAPAVPRRRRRRRAIVGLGPDAGGPAGAPKADLTALLVMLYSDAMANLGQAPDPVTGRPHVDLDQARFAIDLLAMLQEKTRSNRTPDESAVLEEMLSTLRMGYVRISQARRGDR